MVRRRTRKNPSLPSAPPRRRAGGVDPAKLDSSLSKIGGKGLFVKELEEALARGDADIAVHSMKDVPMDFPDGLGLYCICEREDPRDAFVSNAWDSLEALPPGSIVSRRA